MQVPLQIFPVCLALFLRCSYCSKKLLQGKTVKRPTSMSPMGHKARAPHRVIPVPIQALCCEGSIVSLTMLRDNLLKVAMVQILACKLYVVLYCRNAECLTYEQICFKAAEAKAQGWTIGYGGSVRSR